MNELIIPAAFIDLCAVLMMLVDVQESRNDCVNASEQMRLPFNCTINLHIIWFYVERTQLIIRLFYQKSIYSTCIIPYIAIEIRVQ